MVTVDQSSLCLSVPSLIKNTVCDASKLLYLLFFPASIWRGFYGKLPFTIGPSYLHLWLSTICGFKQECFLDLSGDRTRDILHAKLLCYMEAFLNWAGASGWDKFCCHCHHPNCTSSSFFLPPPPSIRHSFSSSFFLAPRIEKCRKQAKETVCRG